MKDERGGGRPAVLWGGGNWDNVKVERGNCRKGKKEPKRNRGKLAIIECENTRKRGHDHKGRIAGQGCLMGGECWENIERGAKGKEGIVGRKKKKMPII